MVMEKKGENKGEKKAKIKAKINVEKPHNTLENALNL